MSHVTQPQNSFTAILCGVFLSADLIILLIFSWRVFLADANHWSLDNSKLIWPLVVQVLALFTLRLTQTRPRRLLSLTSLIGLLTLAVSWGCIEWNLLVPYEQWLRRGMPDPWTRVQNATTRSDASAPKHPGQQGSLKAKRANKARRPRASNASRFGKLTKQDILRHNPQLSPSSPVRVSLDPSCDQRKTINEGHWYLGKKDKAEYFAIEEWVRDQYIHDIHKIVYDLDDEQVLILTRPSFRDYKGMQEGLERFQIPIEIRPTCKNQEQMLAALEEVRAFIKDHDRFNELVSSGIEFTSSKPIILVKEFGYHLMEKLEREYGDQLIVRVFDPEIDE